MSLWRRMRGVARDQLGLELGSSPVRPLERALDASDLDSAAREAFVSELERRGAESGGFRTLVRGVTNGQTYFMRDLAQLASLEAFLRLSAARPGRTLHVWCAGCSTGEEPYTVAMLARRANVTVRIVATDINEDSLEWAQEAVYGEWSLRHVEPQDKLAHFIPVRQGFRLSESLHKRVSFRRHNLATEQPCKAPTPEGTWDVILCRNVLIYFAADARARVIRGLESVLCPEAALLLSSTESVRGLGTRLRPRYLAGGYVLSPVSQGGSLSPSLPPQARGAEVSPAEQRSVQPSRMIPTAHLSSPPRSRAISAARYWMNLGNDWLRQHEFDQALDAYAQANRLASVNFEPYLLMAIVRIKRSASNEAKEALRSALFLEPRAWSAEYLLAGLHAREGEAAKAGASLDRAIELLSQTTTLVECSSDCVGIDPLWYTREQALALCHRRCTALRGKVQR